MYVRGMAASSLLCVPVIRHFVTWMGGVNATKQNAVQVLKQGFCSGISPDGIAGIFEVNDPNEVIAASLPSTTIVLLLVGYGHSQEAGHI